MANVKNNSESRRVCFWVPILILCLTLQSACYGSKTNVERFSDLVDRCRKFIDTGDFPSRGLFWLEGTKIWTYHDGLGLKVEYDGNSLVDLYCRVSSWETVWGAEAPTWDTEELIEVFDLLSAMAPVWISEEVGSVGGVSRESTQNDSSSETILFRGGERNESLKTGTIYIVIHGDFETGTVSAVLGKGETYLEDTD